MTAKCEGLKCKLVHGDEFFLSHSYNEQMTYSQTYTEWLVIKWSPCINP